MRALAIATLWAVCAPAWAATVEGRVLERGTATPLPSAEVLVDGQPVPVDGDGRFTVELPDGVDVAIIVVEADHSGQTLTVRGPLDQPLRVFLEPSSAPGEIVIVAFAPTSDHSRHRVDAEMAYETPGTYDDAVRLVQAMPGVNVQREFSPSSGDLSVRGSLVGDNRYFLDGIEIPYLYHFNQYASVFPASSLSTLDLYSSTFGARFGDSTGAIIDATSDTERPQDVTGDVGLNFVNVGATVKVPLPKRWWVGASGRRSFHDIAGETSTQYPKWPVFYDFAARAEHTGKHDSVGIFATGAGDAYARAVGELDLLDPVQQGQAPRLDYARDWQLVGARYTWKGGRVVGAVVHDLLKAAVSVGGASRQRTVTVPVRVDAKVPMTDRLSWSVGGELLPEVLIADVSDAGTYGALVAREAPALAWRVDRKGTTWRGRAGGYAELQAQLGPVRLMPGLRLGVDTVSWSPTIEPRMAARFRVADQTELRLAVGRYQQRPDTYQLLADASLPTTSSWQAAVGLDQTIARRLEILAEGFVKAMDDVVVQPIDRAPEVRDRGLAYGGELTVRYRLRETFFLWAWFAYGRAWWIDEEGQRTRSSADQPWQGGLVASWNILPQLNVAVRYRVASGLPFTGIDGSTYDGTADAWLPTYAVENGERMPLYQKIDLHTAYTFLLKRWSLAISADVWIVPKSSAQLYPTWSYDYAEQGYVVGPTVLPLLGVRASF